MPSARPTAPTGTLWLHEIKYDGIRLVVRRDGKRVRVYTRRGYDWTGKYPLIEDALHSLRVRSATLDGEAVCCTQDGLPDFEKLRSQAYDDHVFLYAFDLLELNGEDWRQRQLEKRKAKLERLLTSNMGLRFSEHIEGEGPIIFEHACKLNFEGIVSKRRELPYRSGRVRTWIKCRNPESPAALRIIEEGSW